MPWDDLEIFEVIMELGEKLSIQIPDEDMEKTIPKTLGEFVAFVASYLPSQIFKEGIAWNLQNSILLI